jgi:hypothetical protein
MQMRDIQQFLRNATHPVIDTDFAARWAKPGLAGEGHNPFFIAFRTDVASVAALRITAIHHLFDHLLHVGPLIGRYLLLAIIPPLCPVVDEDLAAAVATILRGRMKQQESHFFACGNSQYLLTGVSKTAIIADKVLLLLSVVLIRHLAKG